MKMIDQKILDELKEIYELEQGKKGFKLHIETKIGSADIFFSKHDMFYCSYKIRNPDGEIIKEGQGDFKKIKAAQRYLVRICCNDVYSKLELGNN